MKKEILKEFIPGMVTCTIIASLILIVDRTPDFTSFTISLGIVSGLLILLTWVVGE